MFTDFLPHGCRPLAPLPSPLRSMCQRGTRVGGEGPVTPISRRGFVGIGAGLVAGAALPAVTPTTAAAAAATGTITDVKHVVILMQENRSFDHYFGKLKGVRGYGDRAMRQHPRRLGHVQPAQLGRSPVPVEALRDPMRRAGSTARPWPSATATSRTAGPRSTRPGTRAGWTTGCWGSATPAPSATWTARTYPSTTGSPTTTRSATRTSAPRSAPPARTAPSCGAARSTRPARTAATSPG